jgi:NAD(P)H-dependent flavin oxidoreductase YrpB (nitropropane dioxygenase family)
MLRTALCEKLGIRYPVLQAGMGIFKGVVTPPALVAAVSNAGGLGCLGGSGLEPEELREAIRKIRTLTDKPFGVDLLIPSRMSAKQGSREEIRREISVAYPEHRKLVDGLFERYGVPRSKVDKAFSITEEMTSEQARVVFEERVPVFVVGLGDPGKFRDIARETGTLIAGIAGSLNNARKQVQANVDFLIVQGAEAGGHVGTIGTFPLVPQVVDAVGSLPVVAAGGIADGRGLAAALALGAQAVWCGTAFLFADEVNLHPQHREQLDIGRSEDFVVSRVFTGKTSRTFHNDVHRVWAESGLDPLPLPHQKILMEDFLDAARRAGRLDVCGNPAGQVAGMLKGARPAATIVADMVTQAEQIIRRCSGLLRA